MTITHDTKKFLLVFGIAGILFWLTKPGVKIRKPSSTKEPDPDKQKKDANTVVEAYITAVIAGEPASSLEELNRLSEKKYNMRVYKKGDGKYYVKDVNGNDIKLK